MEFEVLAAPPTATQTISDSVATFYGVPLTTDRVIFVIDASGSMDTKDADDRTKTRLDVALSEIRRAAERLSDSTRVNVLFFGDEVAPWKRSLVALSSANRARLAKDLQNRRSGGHTNIYGALEVALADRSVDTIVLLSDGVPDRGRYHRTEDILRAVGRLNQTRRITIHTIAIGRHSELLRLLAAANDGAYHRR